jgi:hypothetical protein
MLSAITKLLLRVAKNHYKPVLRDVGNRYKPVLRDVENRSQTGVEGC